MPSRLSPRATSVLFSTLAAVTLALSLLVSGCVGESETDPEPSELTPTVSVTVPADDAANTRVAPGPGPSLRRSLGAIWEFEPLEPGMSAPVIAGSTAYAGSMDDHLYAVDVRTGAERWHTDVGSSVLPPPTHHDDRLFVTPRDSSLRAFDAPTGDLLWTRNVSGVNLQDAAADGSIVSVRGSDGNLYAFGTAGGARTWTRAFDAESVSAPVVSRSLVLVHYPADTTRVLEALDAESGRTAWTFRSPQIVGQPALAQGLVLAVTNTPDAGLVALNAETGEVEWTITEGNDISPPLAIRGDMLYLMRSNGTVEAVRLSSQSQQWSASGYRAGDRLQLAGESLYVVDSRPSGLQITARDARQGTLQESILIRGIRGTSPAAIGDSMIVMGAPNGLLHGVGSVDVNTRPQRMMSRARIPAAQQSPVAPPPEPPYVARDTSYGIAKTATFAASQLLPKDAENLELGAATRAYPHGDAFGYFLTSRHTIPSRFPSGPVFYININGEGRPQKTSEIQSTSDTKGVNADQIKNMDFGRSAAALGDLDGNGVPDVAVGAPSLNHAAPNLARIGPTPSIGGVYILFMEEDGVIGSFREISPRTADIDGSPAPSSFLGQRMTTAGDIDGNGVPDLTVGGNDDLWLFLLNEDGSLHDSRLLRHGRSGVRVQDSTYTGPPRTVVDFAAGDFTGDGSPDLAATFAGNASSSDPVVHVFELREDATVRRSHTISPSQQDFLDRRLSQRRGFGTFLSAANLDEDAADELLISAFITGPFGRSENSGTLRLDAASGSAEDPTFRFSILPLTTGINADISPLARLNNDALIELTSVTADTLKVLFPADAAGSFSSSRP